jgi:integrase
MQYWYYFETYLKPLFESLKMKLTDATIINWLKKPDEVYLRDGDIPGFFLQRLKKGASFKFFYRNKAGIARKLTIGKFPPLTAKAARAVALKYYSSVLAGDDIYLSIQKIKAEHLQDDLDRKHGTVSAYLSTVYSKKLERKKSGREIESRIAKHFSHFFDKNLADLTCSDIRSWQHKAELDGLHYATIKKVYGSFKAMINDAVREKIITEHPLLNCHLQKNYISATKKSAHITKGRLYLTPDQSKRFLNALDLYDEMIRQQRRNSILHGKKHLPSLDDLCFADRVKPSMLILYYNGFRIGDVISLTWESVNFENKTFFFTPSKLEHKKPNPQTFPMNDIVYEALRKWWMQNGGLTKGPVFPNPATGQPFNKKSFRYAWQDIKRLGGLPEELHLQTLRHNFASQLIMAGQGLLAIARLMATSVNMIENYYGHLRPDVMSSALNQMIGIAGENEVNNPGLNPGASRAFTVKK